jgi:hypothetical protein
MVAPEISKRWQLSLINLVEIFPKINYSAQAALRIFRYILVK